MMKVNNSTSYPCIGRNSLSYSNHEESIEKYQILNNSTDTNKYKSTFQDFFYFANAGNYI